VRRLWGGRIGAVSPVFAYFSMSHVLGVVLAAGRSRRMGRSKPLLQVGERSFLRAAVETLMAGGCRDVVVVVASSDVETEACSAGARVRWNDAQDAEQVDSLRLGLAAAPADATAALVHPVDHPLVRPATVRALIDAHSAHPGAIVRPSHSGQPGHPTLFPRAVWPALQDDALPDGARSVVEDRATETVDLTVDDPGVLADIDTPDAFQHHLGST
jgi:molybdenum cofactor cytidylyltransferase